jgi:uncharacterized membrane protein YfcA
MEPLTFFVILFGSSIVAGTLGALLGLGGGIIVIPILTLMAGLNIHYAIGASIVSVIATSSGAAATYVRDKITNIRLGMFLEMATTTGAVVGAWMAGLLPGRALSIVFGLVLAHAAWTMYRSRGEDVPTGVVGSPLATRLRLHGTYYDLALSRRVDYQVRGVPQGFGMMWIAGVTAAASAGIYFLRGDIHPFIAAPVALGILIGTVAGTRLLLRLRGAAIRKVFLVVLLVVALQMIWRGVVGTVR